MNLTTKREGKQFIVTATHQFADGTQAYGTSDASWSLEHARRQAMDRCSEAISVKRAQDLANADG